MISLFDRICAAIEPLARIADAFDANELDDEARKFWGQENRHELTTPYDQIELYQGRGGKQLLTLQDCMNARILYRQLKSRRGLSAIGEAKL